MIVTKINRRKEYNYLSRYQGVPQYYNSEDKKTYLGTTYQLSKNIKSYQTYTTKSGDTLDDIALTFYNNPLYWWIISDINSIQDPLKLEAGKRLIIPDINELVFTEKLR